MGDATSKRGSCSFLGHPGGRQRPLSGPSPHRLDTMATGNDFIIRHRALDEATSLQQVCRRAQCVTLRAHAARNTNSIPRQHLVPRRYDLSGTRNSGLSTKLIAHFDTYLLVFAIRILHIRFTQWRSDTSCVRCVRTPCQQNT